MVLKNLLKFPPALVLVHGWLFPATKITDRTFLFQQVISSETKGPGEEGAPDIAPKSFSQKGPKRCSVLFIGAIGKSALKIGHLLRRNFWMTSWGPFLSRPLCFTADLIESGDKLPNFASLNLFEVIPDL